MHTAAAYLAHCPDERHPRVPLLLLVLPPPLRFQHPDNRPPAQLGAGVPLQPLLSALRSPPISLLLLLLSALLLNTLTIACLRRWGRVYRCTHPCRGCAPACLS